MKEKILAFLLFMNALCLTAAFAPGENILANGEFDGFEKDPVTHLPAIVPENWLAGGEPGGADKCLRYYKGGVPSGKGYVRFSQPAPDQLGIETTVRQAGLYLLPGEKYRISALVRTKDFESPHCGIIVYDVGWNKSAGIDSLPKNQDWKRISIDFDMINSPGNSFTFAAFACAFKGTLDVTDVKLEALTEKGLANSKGSEVIALMKQVTLIPWKPLLNKIAIPKAGAFDWLTGRKYPELTLLLNGQLPEKTTVKDYDIRFAINDQPEAVMPLKEEFNTIQFKDGVAPGDFTLKLSICNRKSGEVICRQEHSATFVTLPELSEKGHRRLNNLVVELLDKPISKTDAQQTFDFCTMRDGWVFIAAQNAAAEKLEITLDGKMTVIKADTPRLETFRDIAQGPHTLAIKGAANGGRLVIRSIPEIYNYKPCCDSMLPENPKYDWAMQEKYVHPAITTHNDGVIPPEYRKDYFDRGYKWISSNGTFLRNSDTILKDLNTCGGMNLPYYQGTSCDEQLNGAYNSILPYTDAIKRYVPKEGHVIYTWIGGPKFLPGHYDKDFCSTCINSCHGRGRILFESYCPTRGTRAEADKYLKENVSDIAAKFQQNFPGVMDHFGIIFGNFIQLPVISLAHHTNVDYKYYLDMQFNVLANHPDCKDMAITGYWGTRHCDFEMFRWVFMLTRHYCIEGKKTMLSDEYGFSFEPGHMSNGDFIDGLNAWTPAGNVTTGSQEGYAFNSQGRYHSDGVGDTFAILTKKDAEVSSLTQVAKGLISGKTYCLQFAVVDYNDLKTYKFNPRRVGIDVTLDSGAEIDKAQSWLHVDQRKFGQYPRNHNVPKCNLHHVVFKALKPEVTVTIHNTASAKGEAVAVNYVTLNPYLTLENP